MPLALKEQVELEERHKIVIRGLKKITSLGKDATPKELQAECVNSAKNSPQDGLRMKARSTHYETLASLISYQLVIRKDVTVPGRKTPKHRYALNEEKIRDIGYGELLDEALPQYQAVKMAVF